MKNLYYYCCHAVMILQMITACIMKDLYYLHVHVYMYMYTSTCIHVHYYVHEYPLFLLCLLGVEFGARMINIDGKQIKLQIWDTVSYGRGC